jgi:hypothetical protein
VIVRANDAVAAPEGMSCGYCRTNVAEMSEGIAFGADAQATC